MRITHVQTALTLASIGLAGIIVAGPPALGGGGRRGDRPGDVVRSVEKADLTRQDAQITSTAKRRAKVTITATSKATSAR